MSTLINPASEQISLHPQTASPAPVALEAFPLKRQRSATWKGLATKGLLLALIVGVIGWAAKSYYPTDTNSPTEITATVKRGDLPVTVVERGEVESSKTVDVRCEVEGHQNKIVTIVPEGTRVTKDQVVVTFDTEQLTRSFAEEEIKVKQAEGKAKSAKGELEVQKNKAQTDNDKAVLALTLAELDLAKYIEGEYIVELTKRQGEIELSKKELKEAEEKLEHFRKFVRQGFGTTDQLKLRQFGVENKRFVLESKEAELKVLEKFTRKRQETELKAKAKDAKGELERTKSSGRATVDKAQSELEAAEVSYRLEKQSLERLKKQLANCTVKAPQDGIVVYSKDRFWDPSSRVQAGAMVQFQQNLFSLPDLTQMKVKTKIHEAMVKKLKAGQKVEIKIDAVSNVVLQGTVQNVATLAHSEGYWDERGVKEYLTMISIDNLPVDAGIKPGMSAEVQIRVNYLRDVLLVPVQAVCQKGDKHFAYVVTGAGIEKREVTIGENNDKHVEIKEGLAEGEKVAQDARARLQTEMKANQDKDEKEPDTKISAEPAPAVQTAPSAKK